MRYRQIKKLHLTELTLLSQMRHQLRGIKDHLIASRQLHYNPQHIPKQQRN